MTAQHTTVHVYGEDAINVRDRTQSIGCTVDFGDAVTVFLTPEKEADLLASLMVRAPKLALPEREAPEDGLRRISPEIIAGAVAEWLDEDRERFLREISGHLPEDRIVPFRARPLNQQDGAA